MTKRERTQNMFEEKIVPAESGSGRLFDIHYEPKNKGPIECLGIRFSSDQERHEYFIKQLRQGLEELHAKLGGVPFTTVEEAVERM
ncbi:MAG: hypothetical protein DRG39_00300 [Deltaproteobacteria bacterium]|nr:MAG: hypothetical protein DRG39_00300 [Deltaproteobacteria bacterium]